MTSPTQPDSTPTAKVTAGVLSASFVTILVALSSEFGYEMTPTLAGALVTVGGFVAAYVKRSRPGDHDR